MVRARTGRCDMILTVIIVLAAFACVVGIGVFAGYHIGYGDGLDNGFLQGYDSAMADNRREHYLTD